ncbi:MAG: DHHA1 domain-containing protein [Planctomycetaceae bacterium]|nr:DHHA1 domain-containing protein [Planctomycetaceae bacterium]
MHTTKRWTFRPANPDLERLLVSTLGLSQLVATLLVARDINSIDDAKDFLNTNLKTHLREPELLPGCKEVAERLLQAIQNKQKIAVYGDYDVDGITGIVILCQTIKDLGGNVSYYVPDRLDEGYGLNSEALEKLAKEDVKTVITVDCGINSHEEALQAKRLGIDLLITDHHTLDAELPDAVAIAHTQLVRWKEHWISPGSLAPKEQAKTEQYPFPSLCGAAVALKVAWALGQIAHEGLGKPVSDKFRGRLKEMVGLAAMGTIADFVPLHDENRALVRSGLQFLLPPCASQGLQELFAIAKFGEKNRPISADFIAFQIAPRLNAAGRLGHAKFAVELLMSDDPKRVKTLADEIDRLNEERKSLERKIFQEADKQIYEQFDRENDSAFVLAGDWHRGVIGIVAGRLMDRFHRPVILLGRDKMGLSPAVGSARGVPGFNLYETLKACEKYLVRFGGHEAAAGLTVEDKNIDVFRRAFCEEAAQRISSEERTGELLVDGFFPLSAFTPHSVRQIFQLAPFGSGNPGPIFAAEQITVHQVRAMGKEENHFSAEFYQSGGSLRGVAFHRSDWIEAMKPYSTPMDIVFKVRTNDFNGRVELDILDWRRS